MSASHFILSVAMFYNSVKVRSVQGKSHGQSSSKQTARGPVSIEEPNIFWHFDHGLFLCTSLLLRDQLDFSKTASSTVKKKLQYNSFTIVNGRHVPCSVI
ncbi:hypothetical protein VNO80_24847 [Phaseolus coccineus]|uniref:Uncharacterized protein n=1 Tax=Phaseolus coccineus TaxID=3886 RepID=A0AAN9LU70_PHACN